jgi:hypothetical protein
MLDWTKTGGAGLRGKCRRQKAEKVWTGEYRDHGDYRTWVPCSETEVGSFFTLFYLDLP